MKRLLALLALVLLLASPASAGLDQTKNFAKSTLSTGYTSAATSIVLVAGGGAKFATPPFNAVWWDATDYGDPSDDPSVEIVRVTGISTDTLTVTRAQESTSAANHNTAGKVYLLVAGPTAKLTADILTINTTGSAATLTTTRAINGVNFDGSAPITVTADANTLSGTTLKSTVVNSSLTSVGTLAGLNVGSGQAFVPDGTVAAPGLSFQDGTASGIFSPSAQLVSVTVAGSEKVRFSGSNTTVYNNLLLAGGSTFDVSTGGIAGTYSAASNSHMFSATQTHAGGAGTGNANAIFNMDNRGSNDSISIYNNTTPVFVAQAGGNVGIGAGSFGTSAAGVLGIGNGTAPSTSTADMVQLWAEDVAASSELRVRDEAGNVTTLSPHNVSLYTPDPSQIFPWSYYSRSGFLGKELNVDMYGAIAAIEKLTGKTFIYSRDLPAGDIEDWTAQEAVKKVQVEKQRLDKAMAAEVEVVIADAVEVVTITTRQPSATETETVTKYVLDATTGKVKAKTVTTPKMETIDTPKTESRLKAGVRLDETTGKFWRHVRADEAVVEPYVPKSPPAWIADRLAKKATP